MNTKKILDAIYTYYSKRNEIKKNLRVEIQEEFGEITSENLRKLCERAILEKNSELVDCLVEMSSAFSYHNYILDCWNDLLIEDWHTKQEDIIHIIQGIADPCSLPFIEKAIQMKFPFLESYGTGTRQFMSQCGHALWTINTPEAIEIVRELSHSSDPILKDEMLYRLSRIEEKEVYHKRNFDL